MKKTFVVSKKIIKNLLITSSVFISLFSDVKAVDDSGDFVPNKTVSGTSGRLVTGLVYFIKNKESGNVLNVVHAHQGGTEVQAQPRQDARWDSHRLFSLIEKDGYYFIKNKESGNVLNVVHAHQGGTEVKAQPRQDARWDSHRLFSLIPSSIYKLSATIEDFKYHKMIENFDSFSKSSVSAVVFSMKNESYDTPIEKVKPNIHEVKKSEFSWSFEESHERSFFSKLDVDVDVSGILSFIKFGTNVHSTTQWSTKDSSLEKTETRVFSQVEISMGAEIKIPPRKKIDYKIIWREFDASVPFTATVSIIGYADRLKTNGSVVKMAQVDADGVEALMKYNGYKGEVIGRKGNKILAQISGNLKTKGTFSGDLVMNSSNL